MLQKLDIATKNILLKNMQLQDDIYNSKPVVLVYDTQSYLSKIIWESYTKNMQSFKDARIYIFEEHEKTELKDMLLSLPEDASVFLVQSTSFRLDDFRIRLNLNNAWVGCLEHAHLWYMKEDQIENYIDSLEYNTPYYEMLSDKMKDIFEMWDTLEMKTKDGSVLRAEWWFEEMKRNTGDYTNKRRWWGFPIWENFTEALDFERVNGCFSVYAYPDETFQVQFCEPFRVEIKNSILTCNDEKCPSEFMQILEKIRLGEGWKVFVRELWFGMNTWISKEKRLSDVGAFERVSWFHLSLWKKHNIYRKKFHKDITQRFHIDIFPDVESIAVDGKLIFAEGKYII